MTKLPPNLINRCAERDEACWTTLHAMIHAIAQAALCRLRPHGERNPALLDDLVQEFAQDLLRRDMAPLRGFEGATAKDLEHYLFTALLRFFRRRLNQSRALEVSQSPIETDAEITNGDAMSEALYQACFEEFRSRLTAEQNGMLDVLLSHPPPHDHAMDCRLTRYRKVLYAAFCNWSGYRSPNGRRPRNGSRRRSRRRATDHSGPP
jgi:hypothetical protein